jgi:hypothetical protein
MQEVESDSTTTPALGRAVNMEDGSWIVAAYKDGWIQVGGSPAAI